MDEYIIKIQQAFRSYLRNFFNQSREIEVRGMTLDVIHLINAYPEVSLNKVKLHQLLSGNDTIIDIQGNIQVSQSIPNGTRNRFIEFWARSTTVRFHSDTEMFEIVSVPSLLFVDFN